MGGATAGLRILLGAYHRTIGGDRFLVYGRPNWRVEIVNRSRGVAVASVAVAVVLVGSYFVLTDLGQDQTPRTTIPTTVQ